MPKCYSVAENKSKGCTNRSWFFGNSNIGARTGLRVTTRAICAGTIWLRENGDETEVIGRRLVIKATFLASYDGSSVHKYVEFRIADAHSFMVRSHGFNSSSILVPFPRLFSAVIPVSRMSVCC